MEECPNCIEEMVVESDDKKVCFACGFTTSNLTEEDKETMPDFYKEIMVEQDGKYWIPQYFNGKNASLFFDVDRNWVLTPKVAITEDDKHLFPVTETMKADFSKAERVPMENFALIVTKYFILEE
jgi:hypothetical protein